MTEDFFLIRARMTKILAISILLLASIIVASVSYALDSWTSSVQAWIYPGNPACAASREYTDGRTIHVLKPEYYAVTDSGSLIRRTVSADGCNGYTPENAAQIKSRSQKQFVTVSSSRNGMAALTSSSAKRATAVTTLVTFVNTIGFTGIELDFEEFGSWTSTDYLNYKTFVRELGNALHAKNHQLMVDGPPIGTTLEQGYYRWRYEDFNALPVDHITIMAYDYQYDYGAGNPITPNQWLTNIVRWSKSKISDNNKIVIGIPSYGYHGKTGSYAITIDTFAQSKLFPGFASATRDPYSYEMRWSYGGTSYVYQDTTSLNLKRNLIEKEGIKHISVWHLGGNNWFSGKSESSLPTQPPTPAPQPTPCTCPQS
jgi:spore germination protein YaaH